MPNAQLDMIRRYSRVLREETARYRPPHLGARERRLAREAAHAAESAARAALNTVRGGSTGSS